MWTRIAIAVFLTAIATRSSDAQSVNAAIPQRVLLLYDERTDLPGLAILDASLARSFSVSPAEPTEIYREALDLSRFGSQQYLRMMRDHLRAKYEATPIGVVVAAMGPSLDFIINSETAVFPGATIVFCGVDRRELERRTLPVSATGVLLKREFSPTLEAALRLQPDTTRVVVVAGTSEFDSRLLDQARQEFRKYEKRLAFSYLTDLPMRELLVEVSQLKSHTIILYSTLFRDGAGEAFVPHDVAERLSQVASVPVYAFIDQYLGRGILGGQLYSMDTHGQQAAGLARRILNGTPASALPWVEGSSGSYQFDSRQLSRWRLSETRLPAGSAVRFREISLWERYKTTIVVMAVVLTCQTALIVSLLFQRNVRRRAETTLLERETSLKQRTEQVQDLAGRLIAAQEDERSRIARELHDDIGQRLAGVSIFISGLKRLPAVQASLLRDELATLQSKTIELSESIRQISHDLHPGLLEHAGISAALTSHCTEFAKQHGSNVEINADSDLGAIDPAAALCVYRVTQEALRNIAKHAGARHVQVDLTRSNDDVLLSITDDGKGFDPKQAHEHNGLGLKSIDERVRMAHGALEIVSTPGNGTIVRVRLKGAGTKAGSPPAVIGQHS